MMITDEKFDLIVDVIPELKELFNKRYKILKLVDAFSPIGRRALAEKTDISERIIRKEASLLKEKKMLEATFKGMIITERGKKILLELENLFYEFKGFSDLQQELTEVLNIKDVIIAPVNSNNEEVVIKSLGRVAANYLSKVIEDHTIVGITGGTTVESVIESYKGTKKHHSVTIVPARGSLGNKIEYQANTLVEMLANKLEAKYELLFTPDNMSQETINSLKNEPEIRNTLSKIESIDTLVFGIGKSDTMAKRRSLEDIDLDILKEKKSVAEVFGYYLNSKGEIVHEINTIGIDLHRLNKVKNLIAVAGCIKKADAIIAACKLDSNMVLVTDEGVAKEIIRKVKEERENGKSSN